MVKIVGVCKGTLPTAKNHHFFQCPSRMAFCYFLGLYIKLQFLSYCLMLSKSIVLLSLI